MKKSLEESFRAENAQKFISEGWKFRIKRVGVHRYIVTYKGKREKSIGPFSDMLWKFIEKNGGAKAKPRRDETLLLKEFERLKERVSRLEGFEKNARSKSESCPQIAPWFGFTYCKALSWEKKPSKLMKIYPQLGFNRIMPDRVDKKWYVAPHPDLCRTCVMLLQVPSNLADKLNRVAKLADTMNENLEDAQFSLMQLRESAQNRIRDDHHGCKHLHTEGYCGYWSYNKRSFGRGQKEEIIMKDGTLKKIYQANVVENPLICTSCPGYEPREYTSGT
jgi:hypothetical protein